jgi:hypothetical protein
VRLYSLEPISQNQSAMKQCFSLTTNQHQHQHQQKIQPAEHSLSFSWRIYSKEPCQRAPKKNTITNACGCVDVAYIFITYHWCKNIWQQGFKNLSVLLWTSDYQHLANLNHFPWCRKGQVEHLTENVNGSVRLADKPWLRVLFADLLWEKNIICSLKNYGL